MQKYLLFRLYAPMCSWGDIAVGEVRLSFLHPTKSAILGLIAAALGIKRDEEQKLNELTESFGFAVLVKNMGKQLLDYHTAQVPGQTKKSGNYKTRRDEILSVQHYELNTILSTRAYYTDSVYIIALWKKNEFSFSLAEAGKALEEPKFTVYLGRKSCPPSLPFEPQIIESENLVAAFENCKFTDFLNQDSLTLNAVQMLYWEKTEHPGIESEQEFARRDSPISRKNWLFEERKEYYTTIK